MIKNNTNDIDYFVNFLILENCEGCKQCDPLSDCKQNVICVEQSRAKWLLSMAEKYKKDGKGE